MWIPMLSEVNNSNALDNILTVYRQLICNGLVSWVIIVVVVLTWPRHPTVVGVWRHQSLIRWCVV